MIIDLREVIPGGPMLNITAKCVASIINELQKKHEVIYNSTPKIEMYLEKIKNKNFT